MEKQRRYSRSAEMYLKTIAELTEPGKLVTISSIAERMGISPISATEMIHRMENKGLLKHEPYRGVSLTKTGRRIAMATLRRHRLWERFLVDALGLPWEEVHEMACDLEHAAGAEVTEALNTYLGEPDRCPHGNRIPEASKDTSLAADSQLDQLSAGEDALVSRIQPESPSVLRRLASSGIRPGSRIRVRAIEPFDGRRAIDTPEGAVTLGPKLAAHVHIERLSDESGDESRDA
jgi:DtxR family Mn-dependent transcriptional regulator